MRNVHQSRTTLELNTLLFDRLPEFLLCCHLVAELRDPACSSLLNNVAKSKIPPLFSSPEVAEISVTRKDLHETENRAKRKNKDFLKKSGGRIMVLMGSGGRNRWTLSFLFLSFSCTSFLPLSLFYLLFPSKCHYSGH